MLAQQVPFARVDNDGRGAIESYGGKEMDKWGGYAVERDEVAKVVAEAAKGRSFNPMVITGDVHANYVWDLKTAWDDPSDAAVFRTECGNLRGNAHNHLLDNHRGYVLCEATPMRWR